MRLERILYEKVFNSRILGRQREITRVTRGHPDDNMWLSNFPKFRLFNIFHRALRFIVSREWKFNKSRLDQAGLANEDVSLYVEEEFRRGAYFEHIQRESTHPYQHLLYGWRRQRYFKVDTALKGFEAPQYIKEEARQRTFFDSFVNIYKWQQFVDQNYNSELTGSTYMYNGTRSIFELFMIYGLLSRSSWNRLFFNERRYYSIGDVFRESKEMSEGHIKELDLANEDHFNEFIRRANEHNELFPGYFAPEGENVNPEKLKRTIEEIRREFSFDRLTSSDLNDIGIAAKIHETPFNATKIDSEPLSGDNNIGKKLPDFLEKEEKGSIYGHN